MKIFGKNVLVKPIKSEETIVGGIIVKKKENSSYIGFGEIINCGDTAKCPPNGTKIYFDTLGSKELEFEDKKLVIISDSEILASV